jgi:phage-related protein
MISLPQNIRTFASTHETSDAVALAIFEFAANLDGDAERLWREPTTAEQEGVIARAWQLAEPETTVLHWGNERFYRSDDHGA